MMIEYGSDFHKCDSPFHGKNNLQSIQPDYNLYGDGRMSLVDVMKYIDGKRLWVPAYFCYEIIKSWQRHFPICLYDDDPLSDNDDISVHNIRYKQGDVLLRMNYFGLRTKRTNKGIPVPVIEDHSHSLDSNWALHSDADWCFASLRKTLPVSVGGILWSPKGFTLPAQALPNADFNELAHRRYLAMMQKSQYLQTGGDKESYRKVFVETEQALDNFRESTYIDLESKHIVDVLDITRWNYRKKLNWQTACSLLPNFNVLGREQKTECPFSIVILLQNQEDRDRFRLFLIQHSIYPAILWQIPDDTTFVQAKKISQQIISVHCDARYSQPEIVKMCDIINSYKL